MGLANYTYRLMPQSGDSTPHDELSVSGDLSGGTISLVDLGGGDYAWQFAGLASVAGPSKTQDVTVVGGGVTIALRIAVTTYDGAGFAYLAGYGTDSTPTKGLVLGQNGANAIRARWVDTSTDTVSMLTVNSTVRTAVLRTTTGGALDHVHAWLGAVGE